MLDSALTNEFDRFRGAAPGTTACPAPRINLHFSQLGVVTACCFNRSFVLGVYPENSVSEIWEGPAAAELRAALAAGDFSRGCGKCRQQIEARDFGGSHAVFYTRQAQLLAERRRQLRALPALETSGALPLKLEFNVHNACNLQCVMCHGLASSAIRTRREGLRALPNPYDDRFAQQLEPYLAQVVETVHLTLERTPPELAADIVDRGIMLVGGGSMLKDLDTVLRQETKLPILRSEDPFTAVVYGAGRALDNLDLLKEVAIP